MKNIARRWSDRIHSIYPSPLDRANALALLRINLLIGAAWALLSLFVLWPRIVADVDWRFALLVMQVVVPAAIYALHRLILSHLLEWAQRLVVLGLLIVTVGSITTLPPGQNALYVLVLLPIVAAGLLRPRRELALVTVIVSLGVTASVLGSSVPYGRLPSQDELDTLLAVLLGVWLVSALAGVFKGIERAVISNVLRASARAELLSSLNDRLSAAADENAVLVAAADMITDKLLYTACHAYLFDSQRQLQRHVRTGMGTHHTVTSARFEGDTENGIGQALQTRESVIVSASDPLARRSHLLTSARFGAAVPLLAGEHLLGVLDIQSSESGAPFEGLDLRLLELAARMTAAALERVRETALLRRAIEEQESVTGGLRAQVDSLRLQTQLAGGSWDSYVEGRGQSAFGYDLRRENMAITPAADLPETLRPALARGEPVVLTQGNIQVVNVPIRLRDEVLGAMSFTLPPGRQASERQMDMVRAVAERLALALENARLIEQSQAQAVRERRAGDISNLLIGQQDVSAVLQLAAERFNEALGAVYTHIYLEPAAVPAPDEEAAR